jgi:DNA-binding IclR family transcriptional regulator
MPIEGDRQRDRVLRWFSRRKGTEYTTRQAHDSLGGSMSHLRRVLKELADEGLLRRRWTTTAHWAHLYWMNDL